MACGHSLFDELAPVVGRISDDDVHPAFVTKVTEQPAGYLSLIAGSFWVPQRLNDYVVTYVRQHAGAVGLEICRARVVDRSAMLAHLLKSDVVLHGNLLMDCNPMKQMAGGRSSVVPRLSPVTVRGTNQEPTMSSLQIAELVEKRHDNVKRTIETLSERLVITLPQIEEVSNTGPGPKKVQAYMVGKRDSYVIVAQLSPEFTARLVDRWQEFEAQASIDPMAFLRACKASERVVCPCLLLLAIFQVPAPAVGLSPVSTGHHIRL